MKRIVVCSDGTGNSSNKGRGTNVFAFDVEARIEDVVGFWALPGR